MQVFAWRLSARALPSPSPFSPPPQFPFQFQRAEINTHQICRQFVSSRRCDLCVFADRPVSLCYSRAVTESERLPLASANTGARKRGPKPTNSVVCKHELCYRPAETWKQPCLRVISELTDGS